MTLLLNVQLGGRYVRASEGAGFGLALTKRHSDFSMQNTFEIKTDVGTKVTFSLSLVKS